MKKKKDEEKKVKTTTIDHYFKKKTDNQHGESSQSLHSQTHAKEEEGHQTHSFKWRWGDKKPINITCKKAVTVEESLRTSPNFQKIAQKNNNKELVITKDRKAISTHFPCCLIEQGELLTVMFIKPANRSKNRVRVAAQPQRKSSSDKLVTFHVATKGGKNIVKIIMSNTALKKEVEEITVYAYKGETVKQALKRDDRINKIILKKNCELSELSTEVNTEMSNPVDDLGGKSFKIILVDNSCQPDSQPGSLDDADMLLNESQRSVSDENQVNTQTTEERPMPNSSMTPETSPFHQIPNSEKMLNHLRSRFKDSVKQMKTQQKVSKLSDVQNLFRVEYGKNTQTCLEVKRVKRLMDLSKSVCQVRINGRAEGSGFLLFDKFVLTNGHVVENIYDQERGQLRGNVTVIFSFESLEETDSCGTVQVKTEVAAFEYHTDVPGYRCDWALLELCPDQALPDGLLKHFGFVRPSGGICIIGHPWGGVKQIDPCFIIPPDHRKQAVEKHREENKECIQLVTDAFFNSRQVLSYDTCFYFWSSGSPVFDEYCNVVAMHTGGYGYHNVQGQTQHTIEYAQPLSLIIEQIILKIVETGRFDVLREFLSCEYPEHQEVMENLKKIVDGRNLTAFKNAADNLEVQNDERLKTFFEFFSQREEPAPMDIN
ncbi:serine protease FAM111A-like [Centroberyx affinis]|uniref:serine protease FAM111A-like n=1 Tax=Centroberyx affinis TaxID=166261 RepID=UPI003A5BDB95